MIYPIRPHEREINEWRANQAKDLLLHTNLTMAEISQKVGWKSSTAVSEINQGRNHYDSKLSYPLRPPKNK